MKPLDPTSISSIVQFGTLRHSMSHEAKGHSLVYSQLYPFDGLLNYTSGIIHHVRITGSSVFSFLILAIRSQIQGSPLRFNLQNVLVSINNFLETI